MEIKKVGVAGCGLMGAGIAQVCATAGYDTVVLEVAEDALNRGLDAIRRNLSKAVRKGELKESEMAATLGRVRGTSDVEDLADRDIVIEAIRENVDDKKALFATLDEICSAHVILASNTSSIPIAELAAATERADRFVGLHFFPPVPAMNLVEVIRAFDSSDESVAKATAFARSIGKATIQAKDRAGFIVNLLQIPYLLDAIRALETGIATKEDIDTAMALGCGYPAGPLTLLDYAGLDTIYYITQVMYDEFKNPRYAAPPLLKQMVRAGLYGRKSGRGFYDYAKK